MKLEPVLQLSPLTLQVMIIVGSVTAIGAGLIAIAQIDVKRSLSYSVSAYMGLIFIAVATGQTETALVLLFTYAIAMSLLVMVVGNIIWNNISQDLSQYGGLWSRRPVSGICYLVGAASLVALPPFGGFWSLARMGDRLAEISGLLLLPMNYLNKYSGFPPLLRNNDSLTSPQQIKRDSVIDKLSFCRKLPIS